MDNHQEQHTLLRYVAVRRPIAEALWRAHAEQFWQTILHYAELPEFSDAIVGPVTGDPEAIRFAGTILFTGIVVVAHNESGRQWITEAATNDDAVNEELLKTVLWSKLLEAFCSHFDGERMRNIVTNPLSRDDARFVWYHDLYTRGMQAFEEHGIKDRSTENMALKFAYPDIWAKRLNRILAMDALTNETYEELLHELPFVTDSEAFWNLVDPFLSRRQHDGEDDDALASYSTLSAETTHPFLIPLALVWRCHLAPIACCGVTVARANGLSIWSKIKRANKLASTRALLIATCSSALPPGSYSTRKPSKNIPETARTAHRNADAAYIPRTRESFDRPPGTTIPTASLRRPVVNPDGRRPRPPFANSTGYQRAAAKDCRWHQGD